MATAEQIEWAKLAEVRPGDFLRPLGFECQPGDTLRWVQEDGDGLYVSCTEGRHYLDGQLNEAGELIGFTLAEGVGG